MKKKTKPKATRTIKAPVAPQNRLLVKADGVQVVSITATTLLTGLALVFGLGSDQRLYMWSAEHGVWLANWKMT